MGKVKKQTSKTMVGFSLGSDPNEPETEQEKLNKMKTALFGHFKIEKLEPNVDEMVTHLVRNSYYRDIILGMHKIPVERIMTMLDDLGKESAKRDKEIWEHRIGLNGKNNKHQQKQAKE